MPQDVYERYRKSAKDTRQVFVLWEPYVSKILANQSMHVVIDSSRFTGYIVDCLVADRDFLVKNPDVATRRRGVHISKSLYEYRRSGGDDRVGKGRRWCGRGHGSGRHRKIGRRNRLEEHARQLRTLRYSESTKEHSILADMIENITDVLVKTGAINADPTNGHPTCCITTSCYASCMIPIFIPAEVRCRKRRSDVKLPSCRRLTDAQWESLEPVGELSVPTLVFPRGTDMLTERSQNILDELIEQAKDLAAVLRHRPWQCVAAR